MLFGWSFIEKGNNFLIQTKYSDGRDGHWAKKTFIIFILQLKHNESNTSVHLSFYLTVFLFPSSHQFSQFFPYFISVFLFIFSSAELLYLCCLMIFAHVFCLLHTISYRYHTTKHEARRFSQNARWHFYLLLSSIVL